MMGGSVETALEGVGEWWRWRSKRPLLHASLGEMPACCALAFEFLIAEMGDATASVSPGHESLVSRIAQGLTAPLSVLSRE